MNINKLCTATDSTAYLAPYQPYSERRLSDRNYGCRPYTATEKIPDFKLIRKRFLPKCVCLRGSAPDPAGGLTAPPCRSPAGKGWVTHQSVPPTFVSGSTPLVNSRFFLRHPAFHLKCPAFLMLRISSWKKCLIYMRSAQRQVELRRLGNQLPVLDKANSLCKIVNLYVLPVCDLVWAA